MSVSRSWVNAISSTVSNHYDVLTTPAQIHENPPQSSTGIDRIATKRHTATVVGKTFLSYEDPERDILVGLLRLRNAPKRGHFAGTCAKKWGGRWPRHRAGAPCIWHRRTGAWKRPNEVPDQVCERLPVTFHVC